MTGKAGTPSLYQQYELRDNRTSTQTAQTGTTDRIQEDYDPSQDETEPVTRMADLLPHNLLPKFSGDAGQPFEQLKHIFAAVFQEMWSTALLLSVIILSEIPFWISAVVVTRDFTRIMTCDGITTSKSMTVMTKRQCAGACATQDGCKSFSVTTTAPLLCYLNRVYLRAGVCEGQYTHYNDMNNPCFHGGHFHVHKKACICYGGYVGDYCERLMQDCSEGFLNRYYFNHHGTYICRPKGAPKPIMVHCSMEYGGRTLLLNQTLGTENFTRTWKEYKTGFGSFSGDHWLGNDNIHYITNGRRHHLVAEVWTPGYTYYTILGQRFYNDFLVGPEVDDYKMTFSSTTYSNKWAIAPAKCLVNATPFSTLDVDHSSGAVGLTKSGFWHANPPKCNPTGHLKPADTLWGGDKTDVFWEDGIDGEAVNRIQLFLSSGFHR
ncbi:uncharacterized protein [Haliotis asinina]|uniref:uncharacterized protein n=1 Tax=Haliotis asinina TaxID=109174 RepID=UPI0035319416